MGIKQGEVNKHKKSGIMYAAVFLVTVLVYTVILLLQKAYPFGDKSFLTYDAYVQYKNMFHMLFEWISGGSKGSFIWSMGMGIDAVQELLYYCLSPFNIIVLMLGESRLELSMVLLIIIKSACLPVTVLDGYVVTASNAVIENRAQSGAVQVVAVDVQPGAFAIGDYENFGSEAGKIAFSINGCKTVKEGKLTLADGAFPVIDAGKNLRIAYTAKVAAAEKVEKVNAATLIFTIAPAIGNS